MNISAATLTLTCGCMTYVLRWLPSSVHEVLRCARMGFTGLVRIQCQAAQQKPPRTMWQIHGWLSRSSVRLGPSETEWHFHWQLNSPGSRRSPTWAQASANSSTFSASTTRRCLVRGTPGVTVGCPLHRSSGTTGAVPHRYLPRAVFRCCHQARCGRMGAVLTSLDQHPLSPSWRGGCRSAARGPYDFYRSQHS